MKVQIKTALKKELAGVLAKYTLSFQLLDSPSPGGGKDVALSRRPSHARQHFRDGAGGGAGLGGRLLPPRPLAARVHRLCGARPLRVRHCGQDEVRQQDRERVRSHVNLPPSKCVQLFVRV